MFVLIVSSPYLLVFGDDHVRWYMGANDVEGGSGERHRTRVGLAWESLSEFFMFLNQL